MITGQSMGIKPNIKPSHYHLLFTFLFGVNISNVFVNADLGPFFVTNLNHSF